MLLLVNVSIIRSRVGLIIDFHMFIYGSFWTFSEFGLSCGHGISCEERINGPFLCHYWAAMYVVDKLSGVILLLIPICADFRALHYSVTFSFNSSNLS